MPQLVDWHQRFGPQGLVIIGIHTPEFGWEKPLDKVTSSCRTLGIPYPVALDNDFVTWNRYRTRYWPTLHLIDKRGVIRYTRIGEGGYAEIEAMIRRLLDE
ncbi:MAG: redoxin domain-containing protein [candidate division NC10 bacterium]|nr:redoxin domain-containing protein [candidate division NC10 bacterium]